MITNGLNSKDMKTSLLTNTAFQFKWSIQYTAIHCVRIAIVFIENSTYYIIIYKYGIGYVQSLMKVNTVDSDEVLLSSYSFFKYNDKFRKWL